MKITADTNVLLRAIVRDDPDQARLAEQTLADADIVVLSMPVLCELAWVLKNVYRRERSDIAEAVRDLIAGATVAVDEPAAHAGLAVLDAGGDFADGVIAHLGAVAGGGSFVTFDASAARILSAQNVETILLA